MHSFIEEHRQQWYVATTDCICLRPLSPRCRVVHCRLRAVSKRRGRPGHPRQVSLLQVAIGLLGQKPVTLSACFSARWAGTIILHMIEVSAMHEECALLEKKKKNCSVHTENTTLISRGIVFDVLRPIWSRYFSHGHILSILRHLR